MDQDRFDALARVVSGNRSRRRVLRLLIGGAVSGWLAGRHLTSGGVTQAAQGCGGGLTYCSGSCVDLSSDYLNCGACGYACPSAGQNSYACIGGVCTVTGCATGFVNCGGWTCVDLSSDSLNCGSCGNACPSGVCSSGACAPVDTTADPMAVAGSGGDATASANGGAAVIGNVDSGGNVGNVVSVGDTWGPVWVDGGDVSNSTMIDVTADGGTAIADAGGGSGNVAVN
jgi:hypothetical protein